MAKISVAVDSVLCNDSEDLSGDEFYLLGEAITSDANQCKGILTTPISIHHGEAKSFWMVRPGEVILYKGDLRDDQSVVLKLAAYDEDAAHDWSHRPAWVDEMTGIVKESVSSLGPYGALASKAFDAVIKIVEADKDDLLGTTQEEIPVTGQKVEIREWRFEGHPIPVLSDWDYKVTFRIVRGEPEGGGPSEPEPPHSHEIPPKIPKGGTNPPQTP